MTPEQLAEIKARAEHASGYAIVGVVGVLEALIKEDVPALIAETERLRGRLELAETVCIAYGISPVHFDTTREKAAHELWCEWHEIAQPDLMSLSDERIAELAARRDAKRAEVLKRSAELMQRHPEAAT